jgi:flagellar L-ring protein precursor FlgH
MPRATDGASYSPTRPLSPAPKEQRNGAIYDHNVGVALFEDSRARRIGDIITIVLVEQTQASKSASTTTAKSTDISAVNPTLFGQAAQINLPKKGNALGLNLSAELSSSQDFEGEGDSSLSNSLSGQVTVTISEVLPNGYLVVRGEKRLTINQGNEYIKISGIVRPMDIQADNTVLSTLVADAQISYVGDGDVHNASQMGFMARFFNKWWPF